MQTACDMDAYEPNYSTVKMMSIDKMPEKDCQVPPPPQKKILSKIFEPQPKIIGS